MNTIPHRDMERTVPDYDAKTRESPRVRPEPPPPESLAFGWRLRHIDYGVHGKASVYDQPDNEDIVVTRSPGGLDVEATDTHDNIRRLSYLFQFFERNGVK